MTKCLFCKIRKNHRTIFGRGYLLQCLLRAYLLKIVSLNCYIRRLNLIPRAVGILRFFLLATDLKSYNVYV